MSPDETEPAVPFSAAPQQNLLETESPADEAGRREDMPPFPIVGVGASAGGLEAFTQMLRALPVDTGIAFVLVQHLDPTHDSMLTDILSRATDMPVSEVEDQMPVEANHVYVIPPGANMVISGELLQLSPRTEARGPHRSIDHFFRSLAEEHHQQAIGVILSGTASDGTLGLQAIKAEGGITFAQDSTAQQNSMPRSAIATGCVDFVLPPDEIAREIARIGQHPFVVPSVEVMVEEPTRDSNLDKVLEIIRNTTGVDFTHYRQNTLYRRITRRMVLHKLEGLKEYVQFLEVSPVELEALYQDILINVTSFFRNPESFEALKARAFPKLIQERSRHEPLRVWVLGCSTGEEAYSLAIALSEFAEAAARVIPIQIFATDVNGTGIDRARSGLYSKNLVQDVSPERLRRYFVEVDGSYRITKAIRDMCVFARHNVLADPPFSRMDLISCRNLLIYMEPLIQQRLIPILHFALRTNGFLWLGPSETVGSYRSLFEVEDSRHKLYSKKIGPAHLPIELPFRPHAASEHHRARERSLEVPVGAMDPQKEAERILLARYAPPGVLINSDLDILQFRGDTGLYLAPAPGKASLNVLKMLREGLLVSVRAAVLKAKKEEITVRKEGLRVKSNGGYRDVNVEVIPVRGSSGIVSSLLIVFDQSAYPSAPASLSDSTVVKLKKTRSRNRTVNPAEPELAEPEITRLKQELAATREYLQSVIEQQEAANEELQSANEEVESANEELQSINEELETSKEEIQSSNEELATLNDELQHRNFELSQTNNDLLNFLSSVQMAIVMLGPDFRVRRFTPVAEKVLNLSSADVGHPITDIKLNLSLPGLDQLLAEVIDTDSVKEREVQDKEGRWYSLRVRPYRTTENRIDGVVILLVDVDALKQQEKLRQQVALMDQAWEPILVWEFDTGSITYWNMGAEETYGFTKEQAVGCIPYEMLDSSTPAEVFKATLESEGRWTGEVTHTRRDGQRIEIESRMVLVSDPNRERLVIEANRPITERKEREQVLRQRAKDLAESDRNKNEFIAMLAHELRNPLAPIRNAVEVLKAQPADGAVVERAQEIIARQVQRMARLIDDLLDVARVGKGKVQLRKEQVELGALLKRAVELCQHEIESHSQVLSLKLPLLPVYVEADPIRLEQVFGNLLNNASKYSPKGGHILVTAELEAESQAEGKPKTETVLAATSQPLRTLQVVIRVRDEGMGILSEELPRVFDMFMQSDRPPGRTHGGLGIGLTLVKVLVELHGGSVCAYSAGLDQGTEFVVRLPAFSKPAIDAAPGTLKRPLRPETVSRRILVVDDNEDEAKSMALFLKLAGHLVHIAYDGPMALETVVTLKPEVIFLDIGLPGMNGYEVARKIRQDPDLGKVLLVAVTGYGQYSDRRRALEAGFDHHFTKPVEPQVLQELLTTSTSSDTKTTSA